jgi:hypothetical protein
MSSSLQPLNLWKWNLFRMFLVHSPLQSLHYICVKIIYKMSTIVGPVNICWKSSFLTLEWTHLKETLLECSLYCLYKVYYFVLIENKSWWPFCHMSCLFMITLLTWLARGSNSFQTSQGVATVFTLHLLLPIIILLFFSAKNISSLL